MMILFRTYTTIDTDVIAHLNLKKDYGLCLQTIIDFVFGLDIEPYGVFHMVESIFVPNAGHAFLKQTFSSLLTPSQT